MTQQTETAGKGGGVVDLLAVILPSWLDHKYGRNPNVLYDQYGRPLYSTSNGPAPEGSADTARAEALYGTGPAGYLPVSTVLLLAVGAFLLYKVA